MKSSPNTPDIATIVLLLMAIGVLVLMLRH